MLAMIAGATQMLLVTTAKGETRRLEQIRAGAVLDSAVEMAVLNLTDERPSKRWQVDGSDIAASFDDHQIRLRLQDQTGLIDLNASDGSMLTRLLQSAGASPDEAQTLTDRILDWRSVTPLKSLHGASDTDYAAAGRPYRQRHGPFETVSELQLVLGITQSLYARLAPALTVYSNRPAIDPGVAPAPALRAFYLDSPGQVDATLRARTNQPPMLQQNSTDNLLSPTAGHSYSIDASLDIGGRRYSRTAVIELTGDDHNPYLVLLWR